MVSNSDSMKIINLLIGILLLGSCTKPDVIETITNPYELTGKINRDTTLTSNNIWTLNGRVSIAPGNTLTIEAGTTIKAKPGSGSNASCLIISKGAKIKAQGTFQHPIIFTTTEDGANENVRGMWGGLIILGNAKGSFVGGVNKMQIEGIPASDTLGLYGGNNDNDNSGILTYVSIRHGGANIGEGNEINGLTLGCVGDSTVVNNIEIACNSDDGLELFGGSVNVDNVLLWSISDDCLDIDQGYKGTVSNCLAIASEVTDHLIELDGGEGVYNPNFNIINFNFLDTVTRSTGSGSNIHCRSQANGFVSLNKNTTIKNEIETNVLIDTLGIELDYNIFNWSYYYE